MTDPQPAPTAAARTAACTSRAPGHVVQPTRVLLCDCGSDEDWTPVLVMGAVGDVLTVAAGIELHRYRNHEIARLVDLVETTGPDALLNRRYGLLFLRTWPQDAASVFSLQPADQLPQPCRPA